MKPVFSLAYLTLSGTNPMDQLAIAKEAGYDCISLRPVSQKLPGEPDYSFADENGKPTPLYYSLKAGLEETGMKLNDVELIRILKGVDPEEYVPTLELAAELGCKWALASVWTDDRDFYILNYAKLCDIAARYDMKVNLEFTPFSGIKDLKDSVELLDAVNKSNAYILVDTLHAHRCGITPEELAAVPAERYGFIHLCDGPGWVPPIDHPDMIGVARSKRLYLGQGGIDIKGYLKALPKDQVYSIELPSIAEIQAHGKLNHAKMCLETTKEYFAQIGMF